MNKNIEVEGGEIAIRNSNGDLAIIPKNKVNWVKQKLSEGCHDCIDSLVETLPVASQYARDGSINPNTKKQKDFYNKYLQSDNYRKRLEKQGYKNTGEVIQDRLNNLNQVKFTNVEGMGNIYTKGKINIDKKEMAKYNLDSESIIAHELSHAAGANQSGVYNSSGNLNLNSKEFEELYKRNKNKDVFNHDGQPRELKADIDTMRFLMYKDSIYNTAKETFTKKHLNILKEKYSKNEITKRLLNRLNDDDFIYIMNNIAYNNTTKEDNNIV
jgi:hypothetical protein